MPDCSVVMACLNRVEQMKIALPAMLNEDPAEIVFVDDGSDDGSADLVHDLVPNGRLRYERLTIVMCCPEVIPGPGSLEKLVERVQTDWVVLARVFNIGADKLHLLPEWKDLVGEEWAIGPKSQRCLRFPIAPKSWPDRYGVVWCGAERQVPFIFYGATLRSTWIKSGGYDDIQKGGADGRLAVRAIWTHGILFKGLGDAIGVHLAHPKAMRKKAEEGARR